MWKKEFSFLNIIHIVGLADQVAQFRKKIYVRTYMLSSKFLSGEQIVIEFDQIML